MAKLKATPKNYTEANDVLQGRDSMRLGNNTHLVRMKDGSICVRLHNTYIVEFWPSGRIYLFTGRYRTVTTKDRINQFISGRVYQKAHQWYFVTEGYNWESAGEPFIEGIEVSWHTPKTIAFRRAS
jgi:hypothetical protein